MLLAPTFAFPPGVDTTEPSRESFLQLPLNVYPDEASVLEASASLRKIRVTGTTESQ